MTRNLISALALTTAMLLSGGAMAQTMVGGASVTAEDLPKVQAACDTLAAKESVDSSAVAGAEANETEDASSGDTDAGVNAATTTSIDLALLTYESCKEAGLVQ